MTGRPRRATVTGALCRDGASNNLRPPTTSAAVATPAVAAADSAADVAATADGSYGGRGGCGGGRDLAGGAHPCFRANVVSSRQKASFVRTIGRCSLQCGPVGAVSRSVIFHRMALAGCAKQRQQQRQQQRRQQQRQQQQRQQEYSGPAVTAAAAEADDDGAVRAVAVASAGWRAHHTALIAVRSGVRFRAIMYAAHSAGLRLIPLTQWTRILCAHHRHE